MRICHRCDEFLGSCARYDYQTVDSSVDKYLDKVFEFGRILVRRSEDNGIVVFVRAVLDAPRYVGKKLVRYVRKHDADGIGLAAAQCARGIVGVIVEPFGDLEYAARSLFADLVKPLIGILTLIAHDK